MRKKHIKILFIYDKIIDYNENLYMRYEVQGIVKRHLC